MRKIAVVVVAVLSMSASFGGRAKTFMDSSSNYQFWITATPQTADTSEYDVRIVQTKTNLPIVQFRTTTSVGTPAETTRDLGDEMLKVRLTPRAEGLRAQLDFVNGTKVNDWFDVYWDTTGPNTPMNGENALRVGGDVKAPQVLTRVEPAYTDAARKDRIAGIIIAEVLVDHTGAVRMVRVLKKLPDGLVDSAVDALRQWNFAPATKDGQPVDAIFNLTVNFKST